MRGSDVFLVEDIRSVLRSAYLANRAASMQAEPDRAAYFQGYATALAVIATAFGIELAEPRQPQTVRIVESRREIVVTR